MLHEIYVHETLARMEHSRRRHTVAHTLALDEALRRRALPRAAACHLGRALVGLGARLLSYGGGSQDEAKPLRATRAGAGLAHYTAPPTHSRN
jgi:hypothetical protein